jgi:hypothetical protein
MDSRAEKRHAKSVPIIFSPFSVQNWCPNYAKVRNCSTSGMFFISDRRLSKGCTIHIRTERNARSGEDRKPDAGQLRTVTLAQVKWCKPVTEDPPYCFGVGVRYL